MKIILKLLISLFLFTEIGVASEIKVFEFTEAELSQLEVCLLYTSDAADE